MSASAELHDPVNVALIGRKDEARAQLQTALTEFGASVVFEGEPLDIDLDALQRIAPGVVIVNLDAAIEDALDRLQPVLDDPNVNVVFNEADVTRQLGGWDLARWARHLAAKVMGHQDTNPPPPPDAERLPTSHYMPRPGLPPTPAQMAGERMIEEFTVEADDHADAIPTDYMPMEVLERGQGGDVLDESLGVDMAAIEGAMTPSDVRPEVAPTGVPDSSSPVDEDADIDLGLDLSVLDAAMAQPLREVSRNRAEVPASDEALLDAALGDLELVLDEPADAGGPDAAPAPVFGGYDSDDTDYRADDEVAQLAAQLDELSAPPVRSTESVDDFDFSLVGDDAQPGSAPAGQAAGSLELDSISFDDADLDSADLDSARLDSEGVDGADLDDADLDSIGSDSPGQRIDTSGFGLELEEIAFESDDEATAAVQPKQPAPAKAAPTAAAAASAGDFDFGALELAPMDEEGVASAPVARSAAAAAPSFDFGALGLSLEPLPGEEAVEDVDVSGHVIQRVIVLGASIGGPDALRSFLGGIPEHFPALFVLAQHLDNGFFERLAQQLQKSARIPVRVAQAGQKAAHGEVLLVPSEQRFCVDTDGSISSEPHAQPPRYRPCIDDVMRDIADRFGPRATAIVFSGMAGDAVEGSVYLTSKGGQVWAQTPESCVVSSMVDGASARGVIEFIGTPRELAERCVARFGC